MAPSDQFNKAVWVLASIAMVVGALYLAKELLVPMTLAVLLSFLLSPVCDWLERHRLPRVPAVLVTAFLGFAGLGLLAWIAVVQITELAPKIPEYQANLEAKLHSANAYATGTLSKLTSAGQKIGEKIGENLPESEDVQELMGSGERLYSVRVVSSSSPASPLKVFSAAFGTVLGGLAQVGIVVVLVVFFLIRRDDLRDRFIRLIGRGHVNVTIQMLEDAGARVSRYLLMLLFINGTYGIAVGVGLYFIGLPNAVLWGILAAALRFIPYLGPWLAAAMPIGLAMAISTSWVAVLLVSGLFVVLELLSNNILEPWLYGKNTGVSVVAVLMAAVFWTWLWGIVGLLLATPLTVCLLVIGKHVPQLSFLDVLLGNEPVFTPARRVYQRLVAGDQEEAIELVEEACGDQPLVQVYDTMLISALALAETHWQRDKLDKDRHKFVLSSVREILQDQGERRPETPAAECTEDDADGDSLGAVEPQGSGVCVLCLPARTEADEIAGAMLAQLMELPGCRVEAAPVASSPGEWVDLVRQFKPRVVCISALPPAAVMHARTLCKRLRGQIPAGNQVVGLWHAQGDLSKVKERIGCGAETQVVTTLADAQKQIRLLLADTAEVPLPASRQEGCHSATCFAGSAGIE